MNVFTVALVADESRRPDVRRAIEAAHAATTPFVDQPHERCTFDAGHVVATSYAVHGDTTPIGAYARADEHRFDTFAGLPALEDGGRDWAATLAERRGGDAFDVTSLGGSFSLVRASADEIEVHTSSSGCEPVHIARRPGLTVIGNRATAVRAATWPDQPFAYDADALSTLCAVGWLAHDRYPYSGLELLAPGSAMCIRPDGIAVRSTGVGRATATERFDDADPGVDAGYERLTAALVTAAERLRTFAGDRIRLPLGGDPGTRLLATLCAAAGIEVTLTAGEPHAEVARRVADVLGLPVESAAGREDAGERNARDVQLRRQAWFGEGVASIISPCADLRAEPEVRFGAHGIQVLAGGYSSTGDGPREPVADLGAATKFLDDLALRNGSLLLRDDVRIAQQQINRRTAEELLDEVGPLTYHELAYLRVRVGRGAGAERHADAFGVLDLAPAIDERVLQAVAVLPLDHLRTERTAFEVLRRLQPEVLGIPLAGRRWTFERDAPHPELDPDGWDGRRPSDTTGGPSGTVSSPQEQAWITERLEAPGSLLFETVERAKLLAVLADPGSWSTSHRASLLGAVTARALVDDTWRPADTRRARRRRAEAAGREA
ncbi:MAG: hypothetical protein WEB09_10940 [Nitriliruptor sp.]